MHVRALCRAAGSWLTPEELTKIAEENKVTGRGGLLGYCGGQGGQEGQEGAGGQGQGVRVMVAGGGAGRGHEGHEEGEGT